MIGESWYDTSVAARHRAFWARGCSAVLRVDRSAHTQQALQGLVDLRFDGAFLGACELLGEGGRVFGPSEDSLEVQLGGITDPVVAVSTVHSTTCHPKVIYEYTVGGQKHSSDQLGPSAWGSNKTDHALSVVAQYPVGSSVTVHYNPEHPAKYVLEPGVAGLGVVVTYLGAGSFVVGCIVFFGLAHAFQKPSYRVGGVPIS